MKVFIFITLVCAVFLKAPGEQMVDFSDDLRYVARKIKNTQYDSIATCLKDLVTVEGDLNKIKEDIDSGNLIQAVADGKASISDLKQALADCKDVKSLADQEGDVEGISGIVQCVKDISTEVTDVETFISDFEAGSYVKAFEDAVEVIKEGQTLLADCAL